MPAEEREHAALYWLLIDIYLSKVWDPPPALSPANLAALQRGVAGDVSTPNLKPALGGLEGDER